MQFEQTFKIHYKLFFSSSLAKEGGTQSRSIHPDKLMVS